MKPLVSIVLACVPLAACTDEIPSGHGEIELAITGDTEYAHYQLAVLDVRSGDQLLQRQMSAKANQATRFAAALPAGRPLLVDVLGTDGKGEVVGSGAVVVTLQESTKTTVDIGVLAKAGDVGVLDARISEAQLPQRDYLLADPAQSTAGSQQLLVAKLVDRATEKPLTDATIISIAGAVAPMFLVDPNAGTLTASFTWDTPQQFPATAGATFGYFDSNGRGWAATVSASFDSAAKPVDVELRWSAQLVLSGIVAPDMVVGPPQLRWALALADGTSKSGSPSLVTLVDDGADGVFEKSQVFAASGRIIPFDVEGAASIVMPVDLGGAIFDSDGDQALDSIVTIDKSGVVSTTPWPLE